MPFTRITFDDGDLQADVSTCPTLATGESPGVWKCLCLGDFNVSFVDITCVRLIIISVFYYFTCTDETQRKCILITLSDNIKKMFYTRHRTEPSSLRNKTKIHFHLKTTLFVLHNSLAPS